MATNRNERGSSIIFVASSLLLLLGMGAMALDGGALYSERRSAQNAVDHAALTAAYTECTGGSEADAIAAGLAAADTNGFDNDGITNTVAIVTGGGDFQYRATISTTSPPSFARAIGVESLTTGATAVASCQPGELEGEALFAYGSTCDDELIIQGNGLEVFGAAHSNGDVEMTGENHEVADGIGYGDDFTDSGSTNTYTAAPAGFRPYPIEFDIADYRPGGAVAVDAGSQYYEVDSGISEGTWEAGPQKWTVANTALSPGIYYSPGSIEVGQAVTIDSATGGELDGVVFVAEGPITFKENTEFTAWGGDSNQGLVVFSNYPSSGSCTEIALEMLGNQNVFNGIIFAPHGQVRAQGNSSSSFGGIWGYRVSVDGNGLSLEGPTVGSGGDPTVTFDE